MLDQLNARVFTRGARSCSLLLLSVLIAWAASAQDEPEKQIVITPRDNKTIKEVKIEVKASTTYSEPGNAQEGPVVATELIVVRPKVDRPVEEVRIDVKTSTTYSNTADDWGVGVAVGFEQYRTENINSASLSKNRVLRTTDSTSWHNNLWLVGHRRLRLCEIVQFPLCENVGMFAAAKVVGEDGTAGIKDAAIGVSYVLPNDKFTVGIGAVNHRVRTFGAGLVEGAVVDKSYGNDIPFREHSEWGLVILVTFNVFPNLLKE